LSPIQSQQLGECVLKHSTWMNPLVTSCGG